LELLLLAPRLRFIFSESMKDLHLDSGGPPGQHGGVTGWRAITRVLRSAQAVADAVAADLTNTFFPSVCRICSDPMVASSKVRVCEDCVNRIGPQIGRESEILCARCGDALGMESARFGAALGIDECTTCRLAPPAFTRAVAFSTYDSEMRELLHLLKFEGQHPIAEHILGRRVADAVRRLRPYAAASLVVVPVPLFAAHQRRRGFNQAMLLAQTAVKRLRHTEPDWRLRIEPRVLVRIRDTHALYRLNPSQRRSNLRGAFRITDAAAILDREVLLVDDIMTTGATARECSRVLIAAGAARVWVATAARAQESLQSSQPTSRPQAGVARWDATPTLKPSTIEPDVGRRKRF
jgi:ComF family protein